MGCAAASIKYSMFFVNLFAMFAGLAVLQVATLWFFKISAIVDFFGKTSDNLSFILMGIGGVAALVSFFGTFGAILESIWMLIIFTILMLLLLLGKIACVILLFAKKDVLDKSLEENNVERPENYQWIITGIAAAIGSLEIIAIIFSIYLTHHIRKSGDHKHHDDHDDHHDKKDDHKKDGDKKDGDKKDDDHKDDDEHDEE